MLMTQMRIHLFLCYTKLVEIGQSQMSSTHIFTEKLLWVKICSIASIK